MGGASRLRPSEPRAWGHNAAIDSDRYHISNDVITAAGAFGGALFLALTTRFFYLGVPGR